MLTYHEVQKDEYVYEKGQEPKYFYVMLGGELSEEIVNPNIDSWEWARSKYTSLLEWKENEFDPRAHSALQDHRNSEYTFKPIQ